MKRIQVSAGVIWHPDQDKIFIARRPNGTPYEDFWEYPGGKIEAGESPRQALIRELEEEIGIKVLSSRPFITVTHEYADRLVQLNVFAVSRFSGEPHGREGQSTEWVNVAELSNVRFLDGNRPITNAVRLGSQLAITNVRAFGRGTMLEQISRPEFPGLIQVRDKHLSDDLYLEWIRSVVDVSHKANKQVILSRNSGDPRDWLEQTGAHGIHLDSAQLMKSSQRPVERPFWLSASCHDRNELRKAADIDVDFVLLSPVKNTRTHPDARPLGWDKFSELVEEANLPVFALGGLKTADLDEVWIRGGQGVAMISGAWS